ncbi:MAG TPA: K(+)-transporting ATPase subunit F [Gemmatimonadaceae bacterium]|nr:K(+)-transporting ATPase subunit F [Gemmatimonadaceae bacterium]
MTVDSIVAAIVSLVLVCYLFYTLLRPDRF